MQKYIKNYYNYYWLSETDYIKCECCDKEAKNIHHIEFRSHFWKKKKRLQDNVSNLIALCPLDHNLAHWIWWRITKEELQAIHNQNYYEN